MDKFIIIFLRQINKRLKLIKAQGYFQAQTR